MNGSRMDDSIGGYVVPVDRFGNWTAEQQTFAWHTNKPFVEVSQKQFFAAIGPFDIVTIAIGDYATGYGRFATRGGFEVGRLYSGRNSKPSNYVLTREFAEKHRAVLKACITRRGEHLVEDGAEQTDQAATEQEVEGAASPRPDRPR